MKKKILIYGTGKSAQTYYQDTIYSKCVELIGFVDRDINKIGTKLYDYVVISPNDIQNYRWDYIVVASVFYDEIKEALVGLGIEEYRILNKAGLETILIHERYRSYNQLNYDVENVDLSPVDGFDKVVIYTAITNHYDELKEPTFINKDCKYICYTDDMTLQSKVWEICPLEIINCDMNRSAKKIKVLPHQYLAEYDWSIWVDGKFEICGDLIELLKVYHRKSDFVAFPHFSRDNSYHEAEICINRQIDTADVIQKQINRYREEGYQADNELIEGGVIFRKHNDPKIIRLMELWWKEIMENSKRDQISFNYVAWKEKYRFDLIDLHLYDNNYLKYIPHLTER